VLSIHSYIRKSNPIHRQSIYPFPLTLHPRNGNSTHHKRCLPPNATQCSFHPSARSLLKSPTKKTNVKNESKPFIEKTPHNKTVTHNGVSLEANTFLQPIIYKRTKPHRIITNPKPKHRFLCRQSTQTLPKPERETKPKNPKKREGRRRSDHIQSAFACCWLIGFRPELLLFGGLSGLPSGFPLNGLFEFGSVALIGAPPTAPRPDVLIFFSGE
jgi:hypothetical protein